MESFHYGIIGSMLLGLFSPWPRRHALTWLHFASPTLSSLLAWPMALSCAVLSWHAIEKPAMSLRHRPGGAVSGARESPAVA